MLRLGEARHVRQRKRFVEQVNELAADVAALSDSTLRERFRELGPRPSDEELPVAFAIAREVAERTLGQRPYDVQIEAGFVLWRGQIAEMKTGEGKTLTAVAPVACAALAGKGVHVVTVNDYLAERDAEWMRPVYEALGLSVGYLTHDSTPQERRAAYGADVTYVANTQVGFDYLRDNLVHGLVEKVQRGLYFALVDEVDSVLIDEAKTPLIISGRPEATESTYRKFAGLVRGMRGRPAREILRSRGERAYPEDEDYDYEYDLKLKTVAPTETGVRRVEKHLGIENLYAPGNAPLVNHLMQALRAHVLLERDRDYAVIDDQVKIIDEHTGRVLEGRHWTDGLHQAVEAKEGLRPSAHNPTVATITYQNLFRSYERLAGMSGTAATDAAEFEAIYKLRVAEIPTHRPVRRIDQPDLVYRTKQAKWRAVLDEIAERHEKGQPILVGTASLADSELLSRELRRRGIRHNLLNAKPENARREGEIVAEAGRAGAVTIATNMAGRGVDIKLGGSGEAEAERVRELGGLYVIGTERHTSRRIDNQLRGRSGRQGDPGESRFFVSTEDEVLRVWGGEKLGRMLAMLEGMGSGEEVPLESKRVSRQIEQAQQALEHRNFLERKRTLEYDDVLQAQREAIYGWRDRILAGEVAEDDWRRVAEAWLRRAGADGEILEPEQRQALGELIAEAGVSEELPTELEYRDEALERIAAMIERALEAKAKEIGPKVFRRAQRDILLFTLDRNWQAHLDDMEYLREGIHLRGHAQIDPLAAYRKEGFELFDEMLTRVHEEHLALLLHARVERKGE